ncbi:MAG: hypothetical protein Q9227_003532 [Pyrenula ochraceoflavens]
MASPGPKDNVEGKNVHQSLSPSEHRESAAGSQPRRSSRLMSLAEKRGPRDDGKIELTEEDAYEATGFAFPTWKKWMILTVIFGVQSSMNYNTSVYPNLVKPLSKEFGLSSQGARVGQMIYLVSYSFGCELWAPWSEEYGRWPILQLSCFLINLWQIPCGVAKNFNTIIAARFFGGLSTAGGSVTLGMVADLFKSDDQQYAVAFVVLSSVGGTTIGPIFGGMIEAWLPWRWNFWIQLIFGGAVQLAHFFLVPETRTTIMLDKEAKRRRKAGISSNIYGPNELKEGPRLTAKEFFVILSRPFEMFLREPIVLCLSLLSGFSDALIFTFLESFQPVFEQWGFSTVQIGLVFCCIVVGYLLCYFSFFPIIHRHRQIRKRDPDALQPEARLWWLLFIAPLETIGLFGFAWTSMGPPIPWIAPVIFSTLIAMANYGIYMATIDYMIASYGPYSASATGGNGFARDFLAGISAMYATPMYSNIPGKYHLQWASTILAFLAILVTIPIYIFYWKGPVIREKSKFAQILASDRKAGIGGGVSVSAAKQAMEEKGEESA